MPTADDSVAGEPPSESTAPSQPKPIRRDFLVLTAQAAAAIGLGSALWPLIDSMNPAADALALGSIEIDLSPITIGMRIIASWRGKPIFICHRTPREIEEARAVKLAELRDPETDDQRIKRSDWLILIGICTHLGCVPGGTKPGQSRGQFDGWFCTCHGSLYDTSGRIRLGPAPRNLEIPPYAFIGNDRIKIG